MKAQTKAISPRACEFALRAEGFKVLKSACNEAEIQACFSKLKELVPTIPLNKKISKTALLQHVIDYILDLELTLEVHPAAVAAQAPRLLSQMNTERRPLAENTQANTLLHSHQTSHLEKMDVTDCSSSC